MAAAQLDQFPNYAKCEHNYILKHHILENLDVGNIINSPNKTFSRAVGCVLCKEAVMVYHSM